MDPVHTLQPYFFNTKYAVTSLYIQGTLECFYFPEANVEPMDEYTEAISVHQKKCGMILVPHVHAVRCVPTIRTAAWTPNTM
jgi:hypothetical protein